MPDERQDSIKQGLGVPPESEIGKAAERERQDRAAQGPPIGGGMGGTSDAESAPEESQMNRELHESPEFLAETSATPRAGDKKKP